MVGVAILWPGAAPAALGGTTERVSVDSEGTQADGPSISPAISADGRFVAFDSAAINLVPGDTNGRSDILVRDRQTGETTRVSVASDGMQTNSGSDSPHISADGRFVVFSTGAGEFHPVDRNGRFDVYVHDRQTAETTWASIAMGLTDGNGISRLASISADGSFVAFESAASNLIGGDANGVKDIYVRDRQAGQTSRASVASDGEEGNDGSERPSMSADGRFVVFESEASNLVAGDTNGVEDIFVHDRQTGQTIRVSVATGGTEGNGGSDRCSISGDGRFVAFASDADNLVHGDTNEASDAFVHDRQTGQTTRVSVASDGSPANSVSENPGISADGRFVVFVSLATNLVPGDTNNMYDAFVHDRQTGQTTRASVATDGTQGDNGVWKAAISAHGQFVAFESRASTLVSGDTNGADDIFVRDRGESLPTIVHVDDDNDTGSEDGSQWNPFNTIHEGIDAVAHGGTVKVASGTYSGNVVVSSKSVTIQGGYMGGAYPGVGDFSGASRDPDPSTNQTVIDGGGAGVVVECQGAAARGSVLTGFKLRNGGATFRGGLVVKLVIAADDG